VNLGEPVPPPPDEENELARELQRIERRSVEMYEQSAARWVASSDAGRRFLRLLFEWTGLGDKSPDAFSEGQRDVGLRLRKLLSDIDPTLYPSLLLEAAAEEAQRRQDAAARAVI
jgi:hypothetical protein